MSDIQKKIPLQGEAKSSTADNLLYIAIKYKNAIIGALVLIVCLGAGTFFWMRQQQSSEQEAALQLSRVAPLFDQGEYKAAINGKGQIAGLKKIADEHRGTPSGNMAALLLANAYYSAGEYDSALQVFKTVSTGNNDLDAAAQAGAGACYSNKNQFAQAAESYQEASKKAENSVLKSQYLAHSADCFQQLKQLKKASELYTKIIADYPGSTGAAMAQRALWQISGQL